MRVWTHPAKHHPAKHLHQLAPGDPRAHAFQMSVISKWLRYLDNREIRYSHSIHPRAMPPFGEACELPAVIDLDLAGEFIAFTIGTHRDVVRMSFTGLH